MADVEIVTTYKLSNINCFKLEKLIHRFFSPAKFDIAVNDRFGTPVRANEWFLVPLNMIDDMVEKLKENTISEYYYDTNSAKILKY